MNKTQVLDYIKKSFSLKNQGFYKPAIEMLYKALAADEGNIEILAQLAHLYNLLENYERAIYYIEKVLEINPKHIESMFLLEQIYISQNDLKSAKEINEKIFELQPNCNNFARKVNILNKLHDFDKIQEIENSCQELDDDALYELASAYYENYNFEKATELLEEAFAKNDKNLRVLLLLGKIYFEKSSQNSDYFEKSKKIFNDLYELDPCAEILNYLGLIQLNEKNFASASQYFSDAHKADDRNPEYCFNLASAYFLNGWLDEALTFFNQAICLDPDNINYHYSLAYFYYQKQDYDKALYELDFINSIEQHHTLSNVLRAMITAKNGDIFAAKNQLEEFIKYNEPDDFAYSELSKIYKELSQNEQAKKMMEQAHELNPSSLEYLAELLQIEFDNKNYDKALELAEKALELNDKYVHAHIYIAKINLELKNFNEVFEAAQEIIELDSNSPEGYYYNALALFEQGDTNFAIESLKKAISLDLNNASLYVKMSEFYQDLGDLKMAYGWAQEAEEIDDRNYKYKWLCANLASALHKEEEAAKYYSLSYRLASFDKDLCNDYAKYLKSVGKEKQAEKIIKS